MRCSRDEALTDPDDLLSVDMDAVAAGTVLTWYFTDLCLDSEPGEGVNEPFGDELESVGNSQFGFGGPCLPGEGDRILVGTRRRGHPPAGARA